MKTQKACPVCKLEETEVISTSDAGRLTSYRCDRCGEFIISNMAEGMVERRQLGPKLSAWIRDRNEQVQDNPKIDSDFLKEIEKTIPNYSPSQKQLILLRHIERKTSFPGHSVNVVSNLDFPLAWASQAEEFTYYLDSLIHRGLLRCTDGSIDVFDSFAHLVQITPDGWNYLDQHAKSSVLSDQAFVAMSFSPGLNPIWEYAIQPAVSKSGYKAYRVDAEPHSERIDAKIITEIKNSRFLIADVTEQRPGVYFEAGFAIGIGIPVIWCVRKNDLEKVHFDTRQYQHIVWETESDMAEKLYFFICAIIGNRRNLDPTTQ